MSAMTGPRMAGPQKAAALVLALGEAAAGPLIGRMGEDELRDLSLAMSGLGAVSAEAVEALAREFGEAMGRAGGLTGGWDSTERLLLRALPPERVAQILEEIRGPAGRTMWDKLGAVPEGVLANYLRNEYPQTVAVVLGKVKPDHAARVLSLLPEAFASEVVVRMLRMESVQQEALEGVERTLRAEFMGNLARTSRRDPHEAMADIFNSLDRQAEGRMMAALEERSRESAARIRGLMFTFDDLARLDGAGVQALIRAVEKDRLALALKGASEGLREMFLKNLSERAAKMLRDDIEGLGPVRLRDVDEAQAVMVSRAKDLAAQGQIVLQDGREDEMVY